MTSATSSNAGRPDIQVVNADGTVSVRETMTVVFYCRTPHLRMREEVAQSIREFAALVSFSALTSYVDYEGDEQDLDAGTLENIIRERFFAPGHFQNANIALVGGGFYARDFSLCYSGTAMGNPEVPDEASFLWCWVPRRFFLENRQRFLAFADATNARLPHTFGYVSPSLAGENKQRKQALGARYPGLDLALPAPVAYDIAGKAAGAYWVNYLGPELSARVGGSDAMRGALPPEATVKLLAGGKCRIILGAEPEIGDLNRQEFLPAHRAFARFLNAAGVLAIPKHVVYFINAENAADRDAMERWHRRFLMT